MKFKAYKSLTGSFLYLGCAGPCEPGVINCVKIYGELGEEYSVHYTDGYKEQFFGRFNTLKAAKVAAKELIEYGHDSFRGRGQRGVGV